MAASSSMPKYLLHWLMINVAMATVDNALGGWRDSYCTPNNSYRSFLGGKNKQSTSLILDEQTH